MALKRRPATRVVRILIPIALFSLIPATAVRRLPYCETLQDLLDQLFTRLVTRGIDLYEKRKGSK